MHSADSFPPAISVLVCTRNRGASVVETVESILACGGPRYEIIVIDQSEDRTTETSIAPYVARGGVNYIRSSTRGLAAARNIGIRAARAELIALTDDDCVVGENWLQRFVAAFSQDSRIGIVHGSVRAGSYDTSSGFIPTYRRDTPFLATTIVDKCRTGGIGACMGLRKRTWNTLWGFDEALGAGGRFRSAEDLDFGLRALQAGMSIYEDPGLYVVHRGFRKWTDGRELVRGYLYGIGAMFAKHFKCRQWMVAVYMLHLAWRWLFASPLVDFGRRPSRTLRLAAFLKGLLAGTREPVDRTRNHYA